MATFGHIFLIVIMMSTFKRPCIANDNDDQAVEQRLSRWVREGNAVPRRVWITTHDRTTGYRSSESELLWLNETRKGKICATSELEIVAREARLSLQHAARAFHSPAGKPAPKATLNERAALSHFHIGAMRDSNSRFEPIEPLSGIARHPFASVGCKPHLNNPHNIHKLNITYLIISNNCGSRQPKPRMLLFDMGASVGFYGIPGGLYTSVPTRAVPTKSSKFAPSLPMFYSMYKDRCLEPDDVFAWEPNPRVGSREWFGELPPQIRAKVRYYKDFVFEGKPSDAEATMDEASRHPVNSFLAILQAVAKPDDFVAVKIDIDTPEVELTIVQAIAEKPFLAALIDELYFEYHFYYDGLDFGWKTETKGDVDSALGLMRRLRDLGIRAHFWI